MEPVVEPGRQVLLLLDQAGWHLSGELETPCKIMVFPPPAKRPELNVMENVWQFMPDNWLSNRVFRDHDDIVGIAATTKTASSISLGASSPSDRLVGHVASDPGGLV